MRKIYYNNIFAHILLCLSDKNVIMLFGFICTTRKKHEPLTAQTVNHEAIHVEQYIEITAVAVAIALVCSFIFGWAAWPFIVALTLYYIIYMVEATISWVHNFFATRKKDPAAAADKTYHNSMFEMEAYAHDNNLQYIPNRRSFYELRYFGVI